MRPPVAPSQLNAAFQGIHMCFLGRQVLPGELDAGLPPMPVRGMERARTAAALGIGLHKVASVRQTHSSSVVELGSRYAHGTPTEEELGDADAIVTSLRGTALVIKTADCLPFLISVRSETDEGARWIGAVHAGWRGLAGGIVEKTIERIIGQVRANGISSVAIGITLGPAIGPAVYEVGPEVADQFTIKEKAQGDRWLLNLPANAIVKILDRLVGKDPSPARTELESSALSTLSGHAIPVTGRCDGMLFRLTVDATPFACTYKSNDRFFSHRQGDAGRNVSAIMIREDDRGHG